MSSESATKTTIYWHQAPTTTHLHQKCNRNKSTMETDYSDDPLKRRSSQNNAGIPQQIKEAPSPPIQRLNSNEDFKTARRPENRTIYQSLRHKIRKDYRSPRREYRTEYNSPRRYVRMGPATRRRDSTHPHQHHGPPSAAELQWLQASQIYPGTSTTPTTQLFQEHQHQYTKWWLVRETPLHLRQEGRRRLRQTL